MPKKEEKQDVDVKESAESLELQQKLLKVYAEAPNNTYFRLRDLCYKVDASEVEVTNAWQKLFAKKKVKSSKFFKP